MPTERNGIAPASIIRPAALALAVSGILFVVYPALRPFSDEASLSGAAAFASTLWLVSHIIAILAFILMTFGLAALFLTLRDTAAERPALRGAVLTFFGTGLTLPFYGAELFGLHAIGREAVSQGSIELLHLAESIRFGPGFLMILAGLTMVAIGSILAAVAIWQSRALPRWGGILFAVGFLLYLPQFLGTQPVRVAHGLIVAAGCIWISAGIWRECRPSERPTL